MNAHIKDTATLARIKLRCIECGDCHLWQGSKNDRGHPQKHGKTMRRTVWEFAKGAIPTGKLITVTCNQVSCLNPDHLALTTRSEVARITNARPDVKLRKSAGSARANRAKLGKIDMEIARDIRMSDEPGNVLAHRLDVSESLISLVRRNKTWVDHSNPYLVGLGAR